MIFNMINIIVFLFDLLKEVLVFRCIFLYKFSFKKRGILIVAVSLLILVACSMSSFEKYIPIIYIPVIYVILLYFIEEKEKKSVIYFFLSYICVCQVDTFISAILRIWMKKDYNVKFATALLSTGIVLCICKACKQFGHIFINRRLNKFIIIQIVNLSLIVLLVGTVSNVITYGHDIFYERVTMVLTCIFSILINLFGLVIYNIIESNKYYKELEIINEKYFDVQNKYYEQIQRQNQEIRKFKHDMQAHFICINYFIEHQEYNKATDYIEKISDFLKTTKIKYDVGNDIANAILNEKSYELQQEKICMKVEGKLPAKLIISDYDLCSIFSNLINNAVEACEKVEKNRKIYIKLGFYNKYISLHICNSYNSNQFSLKTTKKDKYNHGFGLLKIKDCVKRYDGNIEIKKTTDKFMVDIVVKAM